MPRDNRQEARREVHLGMESSDASCHGRQVSTSTQTQCSQADAQGNWSTRRKGRRPPCVLASLKPTKIHLCGLGGLWPQEPCRG